MSPGGREEGGGRGQNNEAVIVASDALRYGSMPVLVKKNCHFLHLILKTTRLQAEAILDTVTADQTRTVCQIADNLLAIPLEDGPADAVRKNNKLLTKLGVAKGSIQSKGILISKHRKKIISTFRECSQVLVDVIAHFCNLDDEKEEGKEEEKEEKETKKQSKQEDDGT